MLPTARAKALAPAALLVLALAACDSSNTAPDAAVPLPAPAGDAAARLDGPTSLDLVEADAERGAIDRNAAARYRAYAVLAPQKLPAKYRSTAIGKDATESFRRTALAWKELSGPTKQELADLEGNGFGQLKDSLVTAHFVLRYTTQGDWAVPAVDGDGSGVPDYVEEAGRAFEASWDREIGQLGYPTPKQIVAGQKFYVYFQDLASYYGYCAPENVELLQSGPVPYGTATAYIVMENDFVGFPPNAVDPTGNEPLRLGALRATAAHEFMHALQFAINVYAPSSWLFESHATWAEDQVFDGVNDWHWYVRSFLARPDLPVFSRYLYGAAFYQHHLSETYGLDVPRRIWYATREVPVADAVRREAYGAQWEPFKAFGPVQAVLGIEDFLAGEPTATPRPALRLRATHEAYPVQVSVAPSTNKAANLAPWGLGANAIEFRPAGRGGTLQLAFDGADGYPWRAYAVGTRGNGATSVQPIPLDGAGAGTLAVSGLGSQFVKVTLVAVIAGREGAEVPFAYSASLQ